MGINLTDKQKERIRLRGGNARIDDISGYAWDRIRLRIRERDGYQCQHCKIMVKAGIVDHIKALVNGGSNDDGNLQLLCKPCHDDKTNRDLGYKVRTSIGEDGIPTNAGHHWNA
jgi:5-methylcytosine-specific restriction protein A